MKNTTTNRELAPQIVTHLTNLSKLFTKITIEVQNKEPLFLPDVLIKSLSNLIEMVNINNDNKFLFYGTFGTGKKSAICQIAKILHKEVYILNCENLIHLNINTIIDTLNTAFYELQHYLYEANTIVLFENLDSFFSKKSTINHKDRE